MTGMHKENFGRLSFMKVNYIGSGQFGKVFRGKYEKAVTVAIKRMEKKKTKVDSRLYKLANDHPNVIQHYYTNKDEDFEFLYMATEMCSGNLHALYNGRYNGPEVGDCRSVLSQITTGLQYLHSLEIVHGNLKPSNILISIPKDHSSPQMKLADFGLSHAVRNQDDTGYEDQFRPACSDGWSPFDADGGNRNASFDTFSLGLLFAFAALKGVHPFGRDLKEAKEHIRNRDPMSLDAKEIDLNIRSTQFLQLLVKMICYDPSQRPTTSQILAHPFFMLQPKMAPAKQQHLEDAPTVKLSTTLPSTSTARQPNGEALVKKVKSQHFHHCFPTIINDPLACASEAATTNSSSSSNHLYSSSSSSRSSQAGAGTNGQFIHHECDLLLDKYRVLATLGEGTYGKVVKVKDLAKSKDEDNKSDCFALKITKHKHSEAAKLEINVLETLAHLDPDGKFFCIKMLEWFDYQGHVCIAFEMLGSSLFDFMNANDCQPFPLEQVRHIGYQLSSAVSFLHSNKLTHTDLKLDNVLFVDSSYELVRNSVTGKDYRRVKRADVRLFDFGCATFDHHHHNKIVTVRFYRAPEVVLGLGWQQPCDVWSIGCILFELYSGFHLFKTNTNRVHLAMMERILGHQIPLRMGRQCKKKYFKNGRLRWKKKSQSGCYVKQSCMPLKLYNISGQEDDSLFFDLLKRLLKYDPSERIALNDALQQPFFDKISLRQRLV